VTRAGSSPGRAGRGAGPASRAVDLRCGSVRRSQDRSALGRTPYRDRGTEGSVRDGRASRPPAIGAPTRATERLAPNTVWVARRPNAPSGNIDNLPLDGTCGRKPALDPSASLVRCRGNRDCVTDRLLRACDRVQWSAVTRDTSMSVGGSERASGRFRASCGPTTQRSAAPAGPGQIGSRSRGASRSAPRSKRRCRQLYHRRVVFETRRDHRGRANTYPAGRGRASAGWTNDPGGNSDVRKSTCVPRP